MDPISIQTKQILHAKEISARTGALFSIFKRQKKYEHRIKASSLFENASNIPCPVQQPDESQADFTRRLGDWMVASTNSIFQAEAQQFSTGGHREHRETLSSDPFLGSIFIQRGSVNTDVIQGNRQPPAVTTTISRQRTWDQVPLGLLHLILQCVTRNNLTRGYINAYAGSGIKIPVLLSEMLKYNRRSTCGSIRIEPTFIDDLNIPTYLANTRNTIWDFTFLQTQGGITELFNLFTRLQSNPDNYIEFEEFAQAIPFESGETTSFTSISPVTIENITKTITYRKSDGSTSTYSATFENVQTVTCHVGHSYGTNINGVHIFEALVYNAKIVDSQGNIKNLSDLDVEISANYDTSTLGSFLIGRLTGLRNGPKPVKRKDVDKDDLPPPGDLPPGKVKESEGQPSRSKPGNYRPKSTRTGNDKQKSKPNEFTKLIYDIVESYLSNRLSRTKVQRLSYI